MECFGWPKTSMTSSSNRDSEEKNGNLYKLWDTPMAYLGTNPATYETSQSLNSWGVETNHYDQAEGDGDFSDLVELITFINTTTPTEFYTDLPNRFAIDRFVHTCIVESFLQNEDGWLIEANNVQMARGTADDKQLWTMISFDFDDVFYPAPAPLNIHDYVRYMFDRSNLTRRVFAWDASPNYNATWQRDFKQFLNATFGPAGSIDPSARHATYANFVEPYLARDQMWTISTGLRIADFSVAADITGSLLRTRYTDVLKMFTP